MRLVMGKFRHLSTLSQDKRCVFNSQAITLYIGQLQCSSIISLISMKDITRVGQLLSVRTMQPFVVWGIVFGLYYLISFPLARLADYLAKRVDYSY